MAVGVHNLPCSPRTPYRTGQGSLATAVPGAAAKDWRMFCSS